MEQGQDRPTGDRAELERQMAVARRLRATAEVAARLAPVRDLAEVARVAADAVVDDLDLDGAEVWLAEHGEAVRLRLVAVAGTGTGVVGDTVEVETGATLVADTARTQLPVVVNELGGPHRAAALSPIALDDELQAVVVAYSAVPIPVEVADVLAAFMSVVTASFNTAGLLVRERASKQRFAFLAEAGELLAASLDYTVTLRNVAALAVEALADWCAVSVVGDDSAITRVAVAHADPAKAALAASLEDRFPVDPTAATGVAKVVGSGQAEFIAEVPDSLLVSTSMGDEYLAALRTLGFRSTMIVPMNARGRTVGAITFVRGDDSVAYVPADLALAEELARRAAVAVDNARLHRQVREGEERFRSFVDSLGAVVWEAEPATLRFTFVNQQAEAMLGYPASRWVDEVDFWSSHVHPDDREWVADFWRAATDAGDHYEFEYRMLAADGRVRWLRNIVYVAADEQSQSERLLGLMVDVTERRQWEDELRASRAEFAELARTLQASLLPPHLPEIFGLEVAAHYRPAGHGVDVVGDFYDLFEVGLDGWGVVMGDVCGKGAEAAALTALTRYTVRAAAIRERLPSRVLRLLNEAVLTAETGERFCTAVYGLVVPDGDGVICTVACGGHPLPMVLRVDGRVEQVGRAGSLIGLFHEVELHDEGVYLGPGDALLFFTDGVVEARRTGEQFGDAKLEALLASCAGMRADELVAAVVASVAEFEEGEAGDDLALVCLRVPG
ncbi:MAG TPA: SpoIIE family protein phosphatase [Acidimicrobiales bacterium]|nr:SpoIIE family protein phosphatase [Acidimicrobiales bacterium]